MKKNLTLALMIALSFLAATARAQPNCNFTVSDTSCQGQPVIVTYTGGSSASGTYVWNFDGGVILTGEGQGPYHIRWDTAGEKHLTLSLTLEGHTCTATRVTVVFAQPTLFHMTGGGAVVQGGPGVDVGLSGSQTGVIYMLRLNGVYTGTTVTGTGHDITFGPQTLPGSYSAVARINATECQREMEGNAIVTTAEPAQPTICMVTFDTVSHRNKVIWNRTEGLHLSHFNIFREIYQNNVFEKIGEVPWSQMSVFLDPTADPLVKSDRYRISLSDSLGYESEKSPVHKTIHLNVNPGILGFNLIWNHYEGFEFLTYRIHRRHADDPWQVIDSVASNVNSYTDLYTIPGVMHYYIEVLRPEPCHPSKSGISGVISNTAFAAPLGMGEEDGSDICVWPNPVSDRLHILFPGHGSFRAEIVRPDGVILLREEYPAGRAEVDMTGFPGGLYLIRISGENAVTVRKIVRN